MTRTTRQRRNSESRVFALMVLILTTIASASVFVAELSAQDAGLESLKSQPLPWYDAEAEQIKPVELPPRDDPRSQLRSTISKKPPPSKRNNWWDNWDWGWDPGGTFATVFYWAMWFGLAVAMGFLIVWAMRNLDLRPSLVDADSEPTRSRAQSVAQLPFAVDATDDDFRSLAAKAFQAGDHRNAISWLFSHVLVSLDQRDLIRLKKGKTNRQYLRELSAHRDLSAYYADVMLPFEATFFGDKELKSEQFLTCWNQLDRFEQQIATMSGGAA